MYFGDQITAIHLDNELTKTDVSSQPVRTERSFISEKQIPSITGELKQNRNMYCYVHYSVQIRIISLKYSFVYDHQANRKAYPLGKTERTPSSIQ